MGEKSDVFNKERIFQKEIKGLADEFSRLCKKYDMPFFWTVCVANGEAGSTYVNDGASAAGRGLRLADDRISKHLSVVLGLDVAQPMEEIEGDYLSFGGTEGYIYPDIE